MTKTQNAIVKGASLFLFLALCFSFFSFKSFAVHNEDNEGRTQKNYLAVKGISNTRTSAYRTRNITKEGAAVGSKALIINDTYYVPIKKLLSVIMPRAVVSFSKDAKSITVSGGGIYLTASDASYVVYANDRALFDVTPARVMSDGDMYIPAKTFAKAFGLKMTDSASVLNFSGTVKPILSGAKFYREDEVYWLSRIISAESRGEPLIGQIAVGNVIMNRVKSKSFPNTIWGVIFDRKYGVQFSPISNGTIYNTPVFTSVLAAKICLEGFSVSGDILYFLAPRYATSSWIANNRPYVFTVKNHEFYA